MEIISDDIQLFHFFIRHLDALGVGSGIHAALDLQTAVRRRRGYQIDDHFDAHEGFPPPVLCDPGEHPVLYLVPFAGPGREMRHGDLQPCFVGELLDFRLPQSDPMPVATAAIRRDHQSPCFRIDAPTHLQIPATDALHCELRRIMVDADVDPAHVRGKIVDAIGIRLAKLLDFKVVDPHFFRLPLGTVFLAFSRYKSVWFFIFQLAYRL